MNAKKFSNAMSELDTKYVDEALNYKKKAKKPGWIKWGAMAACLCVAIIGGICSRMFWNSPSNIDINYLLSTANINEVSDLAISDYVIIENRVALYGKVNLDNGQDNGGTDDIGTQNDIAESIEELLSKCLGKQFQENAIQVANGVISDHTCTWYYPKGSGNLKYLIKEDFNGELSLWMFRSFVVDEKIIPEELDNEEKTSYEEEMASLTNFYDTLFPGTIRSPYTYGEVYELIYGVTEANDIISITAEPSDANNTDLGKQIQNDIGTHTYTDRDDIDTFYAATKDLLCYGEDGWKGYYYMYYRFSYSFSTDNQNKLSSGEMTYGSRYLTLILSDGTTIDSMKYDAIRGCIYEYHGIISAPINETVVLKVNDIFGIV